jgi:4-amino-4-deoxy-L-arabinose transferase-like glycosyltransferase
MLVSGFSAMPTLSPEPFLEKPPLFAWISAASFKVFGVSPGAARVPAALFALGTMLVAYFLGKSAAGRLAGLCSAVALGTMWQFAEASHKAVLDGALTIFVAAGREEGHLRATRQSRVGW